MKWSRRGGVWIRDIRGRCGRGQIHFQAEKIQQRCQKIIAQDIADQKQIDDPQILKGFEKVDQTECNQQTDYNEDQKDRAKDLEHASNGAAHGTNRGACCAGSSFLLLAHEWVYLHIWIPLSHELYHIIRNKKTETKKIF